MSDKTTIEWTDATWNPVTGCTKVSAGCDHCYAETFAERFRGTPGHYFESGFDVQLRPDKLVQPLRWTKPKRIFVNSMSDLFHTDIPDEHIDRVFGVMAANLAHARPTHTFQILTKRHSRMRSYLSAAGVQERIAIAAAQVTDEDHADTVHDYVRHHAQWPLPNVWLGVSVENQQWADIRIPALLDTPAAVRFLSCEPLLGPVDLLHSINQDPLAAYHFRPGGIDWVIVGGESGRNARPMHPDWARSLRDQCVTADVPFLFKQHGEWEPIGPLYGEGDDVDDAHMNAVGLEVIDKRRVVELERSGHVTDGYQPGDPRTWLMARVGKKAAGRELDGRTWDEHPTRHEAPA